MNFEPNFDDDSESSLICLACAQQVTYHIQTLEPGMKANVDEIRPTINTVDGCAQMCYDLPGCTHAGFLTPQNQSETSKCLISYEKSTNSCVGESVSGVQPPEGVILITCIKCGTKSVQGCVAKFPSNFLKKLNQKSSNILRVFEKFS